MKSKLSARPKKSPTRATARTSDVRAKPAIVVADLLLDWFATHGRDLPWRSARRDPYAVWVSEIMLQQTRVATVIPYFERFMSRFPDVSSLAQAPVDEVLALWSGLGYYRRARTMHQAALVIAKEHDGRFPSDLHAIRELPGIGAYTSAAIGSIAFGLPVAVVDGNVRRVISRLFAIDEPIDTPSCGLEVAALAQSLLAEDRAGAFNEAIMDLGAMVCVPQTPLCLVCPLSKVCEANRRGIQHSLPNITPRGTSPTIELTAIVASTGSSTLLGLRKKDGLFGGLWEPILVDGPPAGRVAEIVRCAFGDDIVEHLGMIRHVLTHRVLQVHVMRVHAHREATTGIELPDTYERQAWVTDVMAAELGMSSLARKILAR